MAWWKKYAGADTPTPAQSSRSGWWEKYAAPEDAADPADMPEPARLSLFPRESWIEKTMEDYTRSREGLDRLHAEAQAAGVPLGRATRWKRKQLEQQALAGELQAPDTPPISLADVAIEDPNERQSVIRLAQQIQSGPGAQWPNAGDATSIPGEGEDRELTSALSVLEGFRRQTAPEVPGPQFIRRMLPRTTPQPEAGAPPPIDRSAFETAGDIVATAGARFGQGLANAGVAALDIGERATRSAFQNSNIADTLQAIKWRLRGQGAELDAQGGLRQEIGGLSADALGAVADEIQSTQMPQRDGTFLGDVNYYANVAPAEIARMGADLVVGGAAVRGGRALARAAGGLLRRPAESMLQMAPFSVNILGNTFQQSEDRGLSPSETAAEMAKAVGYEILPGLLGMSAILGRLPIGQAMQRTIFGRAAIAAGTEAGTEAITAEAQIANEDWLRRQRGEAPLTDEEKAQMRQDALVIGGVAGGTLGAGAAALDPSIRAAALERSLRRGMKPTIGDRSAAVEEALRASGADPATAAGAASAAAVFDRARNARPLIDTPTAFEMPTTPGLLRSRQRLPGSLQGVAQPEVSTNVESLTGLAPAQPVSDPGADRSLAEQLASVSEIEALRTGQVPTPASPAAPAGATTLPGLGTTAEPRASTLREQRRMRMADGLSTGSSGAQPVSVLPDAADTAGRGAGTAGGPGGLPGGVRFADTAERAGADRGVGQVRPLGGEPADRRAPAASGLELKKGRDLDAPNFGMPEPSRTLPDDSPLLVSRENDNSPERVAMRERLIEQRFTGATPVPDGQRPVAIVLGGGGASGKGTILKSMHSAGQIPASVVELDPDSFKTGDSKRGIEGIPEYQPIVEAGDSRAAAVTHEESSALYKQALARGVAGRYNLVLDRTMSDPKKGKAELQALRDAGYEVRFVGITVDPAEAVDRAVARAKGPEKRFVPVAALLQAHKGFSGALPEYVNMADELVLYDNNVARGETPIPIAVKRGDKLVVLDQARYTQFERKGDIDAAATTARQLVRPVDGGTGQVGLAEGQGPTRRGGPAAAERQDAAGQRAALEVDGRRLNVGAFRAPSKGKPAEGAILLNPPRAGGPTVKQVEAGLTSRLGARAVRRLRESGVLTVVSTRSELPSEIRKSIRRDYLYNGLYHKGVNKAYLIADELDADPASVALHEIGIHYGLRNVLGPRGAEMLREFEALRDRGDTKVLAAYERAREAGTSEARMTEEAAAHYVEANAEARSGLVARMVDAIRAWLNQTFKIPLSALGADTIVGVARGALARAGTERAELEGEALASARVRETAGGFTFQTMRDGRLHVSGDLDRARALISSANIPAKGTRRVSSAGETYLDFSPTFSDAVKAALTGLESTASRAGRVYEHPKTLEGFYVGAPPKYSTARKVKALREQLRQLALEGESGRFWYEESSEAIMDFVGGNIDDADLFAKLLAIYSPQARVDSNTTFAVKAYYQIKAGVPVRVKTAVQDRKAQAAADGAPLREWMGEKTNNFYLNLMVRIDPARIKDLQGATIDMWMMRAFEYPSDAPTATQYRFAEIETNRLARELGWEPQQVQAAIWVAMKARTENPGVKERTEQQSMAAGDMVRKGKMREFTDDAAEARHARRWTQNALAHTPTAEDAQRAGYHFGTGLKANAGQLSWEATPSTKVPLLSWIHGDMEAKNRLQARMADVIGDKILREFDLLAESGVFGYGGWQGAVSPSTQERVAVAAEAREEPGRKTPRRFATKAAADRTSAAAAVYGLLLKQDGVAWHRPFYSDTNEVSNGVHLDLGRPLTAEETQAVYDAVSSAIIETGASADVARTVAPIPHETGVRFLNFGAVEKNGDFFKLVSRAAQKAMPEGEAVTALRFRADGDLVENNWAEDSNGEGYRRRILEAGFGDQLGRLEAQLGPAVQAVFDRTEAERGEALASRRPAVGGRGAAVLRPAEGRQGVEGPPVFRNRKPGPNAVAVTGVHYSPVAGLSALDPTQAGSQFAGAERRRFGAGRFGLENPRLNFYVEEDGGLRPEREAALATAGNVYKVRLENLYDVEADPDGLRAEAGMNVDAFEESVTDAGYDGVLYPPVPGIPSRTAVLFGFKKKVPVQAADEVMASRRLKVDGVERPTTNSAGKPIHPTDEGIRNFWRWFGDSKVVDEEGRPLVVYHGTTRGGFDVFRTGRGSKVENAFFFTPNPRMAATYSGTQKEVDPGEMVAGDDGRLRRLYPVYLKLTSSWETEFGGANWDGTLANPQYNLLDENGDIVDVVDTLEEAEAALEEGQAVEHEAVDNLWMTTDSEVRSAMQAGQDGVILRNVIDDGPELDNYEASDVYVVFRPSQIKSIVGNTGEFSPADDSILASRRRAPTWQPTKDARDTVRALTSGYNMLRTAVSDTKATLKDEAQKRIRIGQHYEEAARLFADYEAMVDAEARDLDARTDARALRAKALEGDRAALRDLEKLTKDREAIKAEIAAARRAGAKLKMHMAAARRTKTTDIEPLMGQLAQLKKLLDTAESMLSKARKLRDWWKAREDSYYNAIDAAIDRREDARRGLNVGIGPAIPNSAAFEIQATESGVKWKGLRGAKRRIRRALQDRMIAFRDAQKDVVEQGGVIDDLSDVYTLETLMHGRATGQIETAEREIIEPMFEVVAKHGLTVGEIEDYLEARYAQYRNESVERRNPENKAGSGMSTEDAKDYLAGRTDGLRGKQKLTAEKRRQLEEVEKYIRKLTKLTRDKMLSSGLIDADLHNTLSQDELYVPLRHIEEGETPRGDGFLEGLALDLGLPTINADFGTRKGTGRGLDTRSAGLQRALGRTTRAQNILGEVIGNYQRAVLVGEKNRVGQGLLRMALQNRAPKLWQVEKVETELKYSESTGLAYRAAKVDSQDPQTLAVFVDGVRYHVWLQEDLARAAKRMAEPELGMVLAASGFVNRTLSNLYTNLSPTFALVNPIRDAQLGLLRVTDDHGAATAATAAAGWKSARGALRAFLDGRKDGKGTMLALQSQAERDKWMQYAEEFVNAGAMTGYVQALRPDQIESLTTVRLKMQTGEGAVGKLGRAGKLVAKHTLDWVSAANTANENALRLSAYAALREKGLTANQAARYAKDLTVNFNRKGEWGSQINALSLFFNAAVQGSHAVLKTVTGPTARKTLAVVAAAQAVLAFFGMDEIDEETGERYWDTKLSEWEKQRNFIIPIGGGEFIKIPTGYGLNIFPYTGLKVAELMRRAIDGDSDLAVGQTVGQILGAIGTAFIPIETTLPGAFVPSAVRPIVEAANGKDTFSGALIAPPESYDRYPTARAESYWPGTPAWAVAAARAAWFIGGGAFAETRTEKPVGFMDWSPNEIQYIVKQYTGGPGQMIGGAIDAAASVLTGQLPDLNNPLNIPVRTLTTFARDPERAVGGLFKQREQKLLRLIDEGKAIYTEQGDDAWEAFKARHAEYLSGVELEETERAGQETLVARREDDFAAAHKDASRALKALRIERRSIINDTSLSFAERRRKADEVEAEIAALQRKALLEFNTQRGR